MWKTGVLISAVSGQKSNANAWFGVKIRDSKTGIEATDLDDQFFVGCTLEGNEKALIATNSIITLTGNHFEYGGNLINTDDALLIAGSNSRVISQGNSFSGIENRTVVVEGANSWFWSYSDFFESGITVNAPAQARIYTPAKLTNVVGAGNVQRLENFVSADANNYISGQLIFNGSASGTSGRIQGTPDNWLTLVAGSAGTRVVNPSFTQNLVLVNNDGTATFQGAVTTPAIKIGNSVSWVTGNGIPSSSTCTQSTRGSLYTDLDTGILYICNQLSDKPLLWRTSYDDPRARLTSTTSQQVVGSLNTNRKASKKVKLSLSKGGNNFTERECPAACGGVAESQTRDSKGRRVSLWSRAGLMPRPRRALFTSVK